MKQTINPKAYAKLSGLLYFLIAICGGFSIGYVPSVIVAEGDAAQTAQNIIEHAGLLRFGIFSDILIILMELVVLVLLYQLFKPVNKTISLVAALSRLGMAIIMGFNLLNLLLPIFLLSGSPYLNGFDTQQLQALTMLSLEAHHYGILAWGVFFGLHLVGLGYLVLRSTFVPKLLGQLLLLGSIGYLLESFSVLVVPEQQVISWIASGLLVVVTIAELSFTFYLLIKGLDAEKWNAIFEKNQIAE
ncbi:MAG: DUF4386 domain-containing protein [Saprospiraceae bacterium]